MKRTGTEDRGPVSVCIDVPRSLAARDWLVSGDGDCSVTATSLKVPNDLVNTRRRFGDADSPALVDGWRRNLCKPRTG